MCIQWTRDKYSAVITQQSNPPISKFNNLCNEFASIGQCSHAIHMHMSNSALFSNFGYDLL